MASGVSGRARDATRFSARRAHPEMLVNCRGSEGRGTRPRRARGRGRDGRANALRDEGKRGWRAPESKRKTRSTIDFSTGITFLFFIREKLAACSKNRRRRQCSSRPMLAERNARRLFARCDRSRRNNTRSLHQFIVLISRSSALARDPLRFRPY